MEREKSLMMVIEKIRKTDDTELLELGRGVRQAGCESARATRAWRCRGCAAFA